jgi:hypothetical protein
MNLSLIVLEGIDGVNATITAKFRLRFLAIVLQLIVVMLRAGARLYANNGGGRTALPLVGVVHRGAAAAL